MEASKGQLSTNREGLDSVQIVTPFLQMLERYNGMTMTPVEIDPLEEAIAAAPAEDMLDEIPQPVLTIVASR